MGRVTLDPDLTNQLAESPMPLEVCDGAGKTLGFFVPKKAFYATIEFGADDPELERREAEGGGRTWAEIRADLEKKYGHAES